jgi:hypothetical protein
MATTVTQQSFWSILRQVLAIVSLVFAALTQALQSIKLSPAASVVLGVFGTVILGLEHYVADPSTGSPTPPTPPAPAPPVPAPPVAAP